MSLTSASPAPETGHEQLELGRQLCFALYTASRAVTRAYAAPLGELGLTYPQYLVLLALWARPEEPRTVGALGQAVQLDSGTLTPLLKRLEAAGLVHRRRDQADERRVLIELTAAGRALRDRAAAVPRVMTERFGLAPDRLAALRDELHRLAAELDDGLPAGAERG